MELVGQGIDLMVAGMATVFIFLTLLVVCTTLMSRLIVRTLPAAGADNVPPAAANVGAAPLDADALAAVRAIDRYRPPAVSEQHPLGLTELVLRDAHQSLLATRMRLDDMLPVAEKLDRVGSGRSSPGAAPPSTPASVIWGKIPGSGSARSRRPCRTRRSRCCCAARTCSAIGTTPTTWCARFVERAATNGVDVFRIFDAMNDVRNLETAIRPRWRSASTPRARSPIPSARCTPSDLWVDLARRIEDLGAIPCASRTWPACCGPTTPSSWSAG
jgi:sodium pump decarboxylase gamma subunit